MGHDLGRKKPGTGTLGPPYLTSLSLDYQLRRASSIYIRFFRYFSHWLITVMSHSDWFGPQMATRSPFLHPSASNPAPICTACLFISPKVNSLFSISKEAIKLLSLSSHCVKIKSLSVKSRVANALPSM